MAASLPVYIAWKHQVEENWNKWQYYIDMYTYSTQMPANSYFTSRLYPAWYQQRLLKKKLYQNMQQLGKISRQELQAYVDMTGDRGTALAYKKIVCGKFFGPWDKVGLAGWAMLTLLAVQVHKPVSWYIVPGLMFAAIIHGIQSKMTQLSLGSVVDFTEWVQESRKAAVWADEYKQKFSSGPPVPVIKASISGIINYLNP